MLLLYPGRVGMEECSLVLILFFLYKIRDRPFGFLVKREEEFFFQRLKSFYFFAIAIRPYTYV